MSAPLLSLRDLSVTFRGDSVQTRAVRNLSLDIAAGETVALVGESGSGKSVSALASLGLLPDNAEQGGSVVWKGAEIDRGDAAAMRRLRGNEIGMIFQEPMTSLNPLHTIEKQIGESLRQHQGMSVEAARARTLDLLNRVGIPGAETRLASYPHELSGGQRQRVMIAQAIALQPALLIADEPTTALDVTTQSGILDLMGGLVEDGDMSLMLITHDLAVLAELSSRIAVMQQGLVVETADTEALFRSHLHAYTGRLLAASSHQPQRHEQPGSPAPLLSVEDLHIGYRGRRSSLFGAPEMTEAVRGVSFAISEGESVGLVGESGCGKSTLARAILGLQAPRAGSIRLGAQAVTGGAVPASMRAAMQIVFQDPYGSFNPRHRVERLVAEPFHLVADAPQGEARKDAVVAALEAVGMTAADSEKYIHEFSGGQRQRIAIARALVIRPKLIILDEAVSALDVSIRAQILDLLAELRDSHGLAYLFISHDLGVVTSITDRVMVMKDGEIVEHGPTADVMGAPAHGYTRELVAARPQIPPEWSPDRKAGR